MVEYIVWVEIGHDVFKAKGGVYREDTAAELTQVLADYWNTYKDELQEMSRSEARQTAQANLQP